MAASERYSFGGFSLDVGERRLLHGDRYVALQPKAYDVLVALVRRAGRLVTKPELLDAAWPGAFVEEGILAVHVSALRKALGDSSRPARYIETVPRSGYRFIATVMEHTPRGVAGDLLVGVGNVARSHHEVYELCGRGRAHLHAASMFEVPQAIDAFRAAIERDATYAPAHAGLALAYCAQASVMMRVAPAGDAYKEARRAALRALAIDGACADAQVALGTVLFFGEWEWGAAERSLRRALEINPAHTQGRVTYGRLLDALGRHDEALNVKLQALQDDPMSPLVHVQVALSHFNQRRFDEAITWANKALALDARHLLAREFLVGAYVQKGDFERGMAEALEHAASFGAPAEALEPIRQAYASGGRAAVVRYSIDRLRSQEYQRAFQLAVLYAEMGDIDHALLHIDRAIALRDPALVDLAVSPVWDRLRSDPRFDERLTVMGLPSRRVAAAS